MALPPHTIRIKRRRNEDPVQTLIVETKRRRVNGEFCFVLQSTVESSVSSVASEVPSTGTPGAQPVAPTDLLVPAIAIPKTRVHGESDATRDGFQPESYSKDDVALSDREGRPSATDRRFPIGAREIKKAVSPARSARLKKKPMPTGPRHRLSESVTSTVDPATLSPTSRAEVRRYHLTRKVKVENGVVELTPGRKRDRGLVPVFIEGTGRVAKKRSALRMGKNGETEFGSDSDEDLGLYGEDDAAGKGGKSGSGSHKPGARKKPQTHFREKALLQEQRTKNVASETEQLSIYPVGDIATTESDELAKQLQDMVLDYIANQPDLKNYPPTAKLPSPVKASKSTQVLGGGVGTGTWADVEKNMDIDQNQTTDAMKLDSDGEEGEWVYDVYFREELKKNQDGSNAVTSGDYGVLVISTSDDEEWWYENQDDDESTSDIWGSDDEDSNAEEYYKNDYPDEDEYDMAYSDDELSTKRPKRPAYRGQRKRGAWDYESDGSYDLERESD